MVLDVDEDGIWSTPRSADGSPSTAADTDDLL